MSRRAQRLSRGFAALFAHRVGGGTTGASRGAVASTPRGENLHAGGSPRFRQGARARSTTVRRRVRISARARDAREIDVRLHMQFLFTKYFETVVLRKRPYLKKEWCVAVVMNPVRSQPQQNNRFRFW